MISVGGLAVEGQPNNVMSHKLSFGMHEGKTFEWIFFKAPWYARWIYLNRAYRQPHNMDEEEGDYFLELYRRATSLAGTCSHCNERTVTRMSLTTLRGTGQLGQVGLYCGECEYGGGSPTSYHAPSFFVDAYTLPRCEQLRVTHEIKRHYLGDEGNLTQAKMEKFFRNDLNFMRAAPSFFQQRPKPIATLD